MKKQKKLTRKVERQIALLSKYYDIDLENRVITIVLHYEKASELFENDLVTKGTPKFKLEILARISELVETIPNDFKIDFKIDVDDYEGYKVDNIVESFKDQLEIFNFQIYQVKFGRLLKAIILILISVSILFVRQILINNSIIDDRVLLTEMLDIAAWVFLWEGVSTLFLRSDEYRNVTFKIINALKSFGLYDKNGNAVSVINREQIVKDWVEVTKREKNAKKMLIIAGAISLALGVIMIVQVVPQFFVKQPNYTEFLLSSIATIVCGTVGILSGIGAYVVYCESTSKIKSLVPLISYVYLIFDAVCVGFVIYYMAVAGLSAKENAVIIINTILMLGSSIIYFIAYLMLRSAAKRNGDIDYYKL